VGLLWVMLALASPPSETMRVWHARAVYAECSGDTQEAARSWRWVQRLARSDGWAWLALQRYFQRTDQAEKAEEAGARALQLGVPSTAPAGANIEASNVEDL